LRGRRPADAHRIQHEGAGPPFRKRQAVISGDS
jgi:hypothetical protein